MFLWFPVLDLARAPRRTARKKGSGYENVDKECAEISYFDIDLKNNTMVLWTDNLVSDTVS
jgi:hypothetical protein